MTATVHTVFALPKACFTVAALLAGLATSSAQAAVAQQQPNTNGGTVVASYSYPSNGSAGMVRPHEQSVTRSADVAGHAGAGLQLSPDPSLLAVAALGALCLSLSWVRPSARHADKLRARLGNGEAATADAGAKA